jgi:hypothetical protein
VSERRFKRNDVITYIYQGHTCEAIVDHVEGDDIHSCASRRVGWRFTQHRPTGVLIEECRATAQLHPDADAVWASYVAELLCPASSVSL